MMHGSGHATCVLIAALLLVSCSKEPTPGDDAQPQSTSAQPSIAPLPAASENVLRAELNAGGIETEYAAHFEADRIVRIVEHRQAPGGNLVGEYAINGARLLRYEGARLREPGMLDLQFDLQGVLLSGRGPDVSDEDIAAIRNRAQLLRSHALAQRATQMHGA